MVTFELHDPGGATTHVVLSKRKKGKSKKRHPPIRMAGV
jgi:hypothetical protein